MFQSKKPKSSRGDRHARKSRLCTQEKSDFQAQYWPNVGPVQAARLGIG